MVFIENKSPFELTKSYGASLLTVSSYFMVNKQTIENIKMSVS